MWTPGKPRDGVLWERVRFKSGGKAPAQPDPGQLAAQQAQANKDAVTESARVNRINEVTPQGNLTYRKVPQGFNQAGFDSAMSKYNTDLDAFNKGGGTQAAGEPTVSYYDPEGRAVYANAGTASRGAAPVAPTREQFTSGDPDAWERVVSLPADAQSALDSQNKLAAILSGYGVDKASNVANATKAPFNLAGLTELPTDVSGDRAKVEDAYFGRAMRLLQPQFDRNETRMRTDLDVRGIPVSSEARTSEESNFAQDRDNAVQNAVDQAIAAGGAEQSRQFGLAQAGRQQGISDRLLERQQPMNELAALLQGAPALQQPNVTPLAQYQVQPPDLAGAYGPALSIYNTRNQQASAGNSAIAGFGGASITAAAIF